MIELGPIWLLRPWWLLVLALAAPPLWFLWKRRARAGIWAKHVDAELLAAMRRLGHIVSVPATALIACGIAIAAVIIMALSGPALRDTSAPSFKNLEGIVIVMDMSPSVARSDALDDAKALAARVIQTAAGRPVALVLFAGEAYGITALSEDPATLETSIAVLDSATMPDEGSRPDRGLDLAHTILKDAGVRGGDVILISDGGGLGPESSHMAEKIRGLDARLNGALVISAETPIYGAPPADEEGLAALVHAGGGEMLDIASLGKAMASARNRMITDDALALVNFRDVGRFLLFAALVPALLLFRRRQ